MKRFSPREIALLMAPVVLIGGLGLWVSKRSKPPPIDDGQVLLTFYVAKPTTLEAFQGFDGAFVVEAKNRQAVNYSFNSSSPSPYLELKTASGVEVSRYQNPQSKFWRDVWGGNTNNSRFTFKLRSLPPGRLSFGFDGFVQLPPVGTSVTLSVHVGGKWKVDREQIKPPDFSIAPRTPLITVREIRITKVVSSRRAGAQEVAGEVVFQLDSPSVNEKTHFEVSFRNLSHFAGGAIGWGTGQAKATLRRRAYEWTIYSSSSTNLQKIVGRASADNRWPLGFEIEPFNFKTAKVGQKLKFKQFPVPLPKN